MEANKESGMSVAIVKQPQQLTYTKEQEQMIRDMYGNGASPTEFAVFLEICKARNLNPFTRQIFFVARWDSQKRREVYTAQVSIDGLRAQAQRTGLYDGQDEPEFEYDENGDLKLARVRIYRKDWSRPAVGVAHFTEYAQYNKEGKLTQMWATKQHIMLAKCAEALAIRKAFPEDTSGLYVAEEMGNNNIPSLDAMAQAADAIKPVSPRTGAPVPPASNDDAAQDAEFFSKPVFEMWRAALEDCDTLDALKQVSQRIKELTLSKEDKDALLATHAGVQKRIKATDKVAAEVADKQRQIREQAELLKVEKKPKKVLPLSPMPALEEREPGADDV
jgi:phage recombination protein Bet